MSKFLCNLHTCIINPCFPIQRAYLLHRIRIHKTIIFVKIHIPTFIFVSTVAKTIQYILQRNPLMINSFICIFLYGLHNFLPQKIFIWKNIIRFYRSFFSSLITFCMHAAKTIYHCRFYQSYDWNNKILYDNARNVGSSSSWLVHCAILCRRLG